VKPAWGRCSGTMGLIALLAGLLSGAAVADTSDTRPTMALILDDLGDRPTLDFQVADFPVMLNCAILPHTPHARRLAERCAESGKEVMLHLPLQAERFNELLGPGRLELDMDEQDFRKTFRKSLASVPDATGVNNHMGSLLTRHPGAMTWLMEELHEHQLFFIDSRTTAHSVAMDMAEEQTVPAAQRDVFLDAERDPERIEAQLDHAIRIAHMTGQVVVIGHPYPETMQVLERRLPWLELETGIRLIAVSELLDESGVAEKNAEKSGRNDHEQASRARTIGDGLRGIGSGHDH